MLATLAHSHLTNYRADVSHCQSNSYSFRLMLKGATTRCKSGVSKSCLVKDHKRNCVLDRDG